MTRPRRKPVTMIVTVTVPEGVTAERARQEVRAKLEGYPGHASLYGPDNRDLDEDGGVRVRRVAPFRVAK